MTIQLKIKLDRQQLPYWSAMLVHEGEGALEVIAPATMNPRNRKEFRDLFGNVTAKIIDAIDKSKDRDDIVRMLIQEEPKLNNKAAGS
jgi:hypothetical protein